MNVHCASAEKYKNFPATQITDINCSELNFMAQAVTSK